MTAMIHWILASFVLLTAQAAIADKTFATADSAVFTNDQILIQMSLIASGDSAPVEGNYEFSGFVFTTETGARPLTVRVPEEAEFNLDEESGTFSDEISLRRFAYETDLDGIELQKIFYEVHGPEAGPVPLFITEDPHPALPWLITAGCVFAVCSAAQIYNMTRECEDLDVEYSLIPLSCRVTCDNQ